MGAGIAVIAYLFLFPAVVVLLVRFGDKKSTKSPPTKV